MKMCFQIVEHKYEQYGKGKECWIRPVIMNLLSNQKYIGYTIGFDTFFMAQGERGKRSNMDENTGKRKAARYSSQNVLSGFLVCANRVEHGKQICKSVPTVSEECLKAILCKLLTMESFDEKKLKDK